MDQAHYRLGRHLMISGFGLTVTYQIPTMTHAPNRPVKNAPTRSDLVGRFSRLLATRKSFQNITVKGYPKYNAYSDAAHVLTVDPIQSSAVSPPNSFCGRSHSCGELTSGHVGEEVTLCGWLQFQRMGGRFITLRDAYGTTQVTVTDEKQELADICSKLGYESVLTVRGTVASRPHGQQNKDMVTGDIEVLASDITVLNPCRKDLPFQMHDFHKVRESLRLEYRYLDLRHSRIQRNLRLRSTIIMKVRDYLCNQHGFVDVETPTLFRKTPGGAKEFVVPTHTPGMYYTLPQSPQQFKQLLMVGGLDRYMQIARCYRDETAKPDRQPEFTQVDIEMSFASQENIKDMVEGLLETLWPETGWGCLQMPFPRITYADAMTQYGIDKPDTRFGMKLTDVSPLVADCGLTVVATAASKYPECSVKAVNFQEAGKKLSRKHLESLSVLGRDLQLVDQVNSLHLFLSCLQYTYIFPCSRTTRVRCINEHLAMDSGGFSMFCHSCINEHLATDSGGFSTVDVRMNSPSNCGTAEYFLEKSSWDWNE
ncbi:Aspartate--tRNA ligase, mitochondrial [Lamellibrachia satsuma]|nr:Aspartate--tRNA ligase, mitochondrial [Lamellibrachia satsuma]